VNRHAAASARQSSSRACDRSTHCVWAFLAYWFVLVGCSANFARRSAYVALARR
jgi:hypothetical protein